MNKTVLLALALSSTFTSFSQEDKLPEGWDLITLDGISAYINAYTGETTYERPTAVASKPKVKHEIDPTIYHKVEQGETLFSIAKKYNLTVDDLYKYNSELTPETLKAGQDIIVGYDSSKEGKVIYEVVEDYFTNPSNNSQHFVKKGETLYSISKAHGVSVEKLKELNSLNSNDLKVGQKLLLK